MGKKSDGGQAAMLAESRAAMERAAREFDKVNLPDIEKMKLALEEDELVGLLQAEQLGDSALGEISLDPRYKAAQMAALEQMQARGQTGLDSLDRMALDDINRSIGGDEQARQAAILQSMAERGALDDGAQLAAQLSSSQAAADRANQQGNQLASQSLQARRQALEAAANMSGQMRGQDYNEQSNLARAKDVINQFNTQNRQGVAAQNLNARQGISSGNVNLRNQQQQFNKGLNQQQFNNEMAKAQGVANVYGNQASLLTNQASMAKSTPGPWGAIGTLAGAGIGAAVSGGNPQAAGVGAQVGGVAGGQFNNFAEGGVKEGQCYEDGSPYGDFRGGGLLEKQQMAQAERSNPYAYAQYKQSNPEPLFTDWMKSKFAASPEQPAQPEASSPSPAAEAKPDDKMAGYAGLIGSIAGGLNPQSGQQQSAQPSFRYNPNMMGFNDGGLRVDEAAEMGMIQPDVNAQKELLAVARGDIMPENSSGGRIIGGANYAGDELPDRINSGEMVLNIKQQDKVKKELDQKTAQSNGFLKILEMIGKK